MISSPTADEPIAHERILLPPFRFPTSAMATEDSQANEMLFEAMTSPLVERWQNQIQGLENVDVRNSEGLTLLQQAVIHGGLDWVEVLLKSGADPSIRSGSGETVLELARRMTRQQPEKENRLAILTLLEVITLWQDKWKIKHRVKVSEKGDPRRSEQQPIQSTLVTSTGPEERESEEDVSGFTILDPLPEEITCIDDALSKFGGLLKSWERRQQNTGARVDSVMEKLSSITDTLSNISREVKEELIDPTDLPSLERLLGERHVTSGNGVIISSKQWQELKRTHKDGTTLLMRAARGGATKCVELLLFCGEDVNALRRGQLYEDEPQRAIDYAVDGGHHEVVLTLLRWDSILPDPDSIQLQRKFQSMIREHEVIKMFLDKRDRFHENLKKGNLQTIEEILINDSHHHGSKYWVDSRGCSSLYNAAKEHRYDIWALLKSKKFVCLKDEESKIQNIMKDEYQKKEFHRAMGKYFTVFDDCHVYKMLSRTKHFGKINAGDILRIYQEANKVHEAKLLMQCLQDEPHFEVIFDMERSDITRVYPCSTAEVRGIADEELNRVYVSANLEKSEAVSNLVHEMCHKVMHVVFHNNGLPYDKKDVERERTYGKIVSTILSPENLNKCNESIKRVMIYPKKQHAQELIVRVPEIITKRMIMNEKGSETNEYERKLFDFFKNHVIQEIEKWINKDAATGCMPTCDIKFYPELLCDLKIDPLHADNVDNAPIQMHNHVRFIQVSNMKLSVSHLENSPERPQCVDWKKFKVLKTYFEIEYRRGSTNQLAVMWDEEIGKQFCNNPSHCDEQCPAKLFEDYKEYVTLVIPKEFVVPRSNVIVEYGWGQLATKTKTWILDRIVKFQGRNVNLREMIGSVGETEEIEAMGNFMDSDDISFIINQGQVEFGNNVESQLQERRQDPLRNQDLTKNHVENFIRRRMTVRPVNFKEGLLQRREMDLVFIFNANEDNVKDEGLGQVLSWNGKLSPGGARCFLVATDLQLENECEQCKKIFDDLSKLPASGGIARFVHFFRYEEKKFFHLQTQCISANRCWLLSDAPGSGKSVHINMKAVEEKNEHPERWIEVVELPGNEEELRKWSTIQHNSKDRVEEFLFLLANKRHKSANTEKKSTFEEKVFKRFCQSKGCASLYIDGFDEISPTYREPCSNLLDTVLRETSVMLWVTTRTHECHGLEKRLRTIAYELVPFNKEEQVSFILREWRFLLKDMEKTKRNAKIDAIISKVKSRCSKSNDEKCAMVESLENLLKDDTLLDERDVCFHKSAEDLIENCRSPVNDEGCLSEIPLHTWMMAIVGFEDDIFFTTSHISLPSIYKRFVELKMKMFSLEKTEGKKREAEDCKEKHYAISILNHLKTFSAFFFLQDEEYKVKDDDIHDLQRVGLVVSKENSVKFIHQTFGEYFFSLWLLDNKNHMKVAKVFLSDVLLEDKYANVRNFIDGLLLQQCNDKSQVVRSNATTLTLRDLSAIPANDLVICIQTCYKSIIECHTGILRYIAEFSGDRVTDIFFSDTDDCSDWFTKNTKGTTPMACRNVFALCGGCVINENQSIDRNIKSLKVLQALLTLAKENHLMENWRNLIEKEGLWWTGCYSEYLWRNEEGRKEFHFIFEFLLAHKNLLGRTLTDKIMAEESKNLFANASTKCFHELKNLLDSVLDGSDFDNLLNPSPEDASFARNRNMVTAWTNVVYERTLEEVESFWVYLESKIKTNDKRAQFLQRKDYKGRNALQASVSKRRSDNVIAYVWQLIRRYSPEEECKRLIFQSFEVESIWSYFYGPTSTFMEWLTNLAQSGFLTFKEALRLLRPMQNMGKQYFQRLDSHLSRDMFSLQDFFTAAWETDDMLVKSEIRDALDSMEGNLAWLAHSCFQSTSNDQSPIIPGILEEFNRMQQSLRRMPAIDVPSDEEGFIKGVLRGDHTIKSDRFTEYLVILWRQLELESKVLSVEILAGRLIREWKRIYSHFPVFKIKVKDQVTVETMSFLIPHFFTTLSRFLTENQLGNLLLHPVDNYSSAFRIALRRNDGVTFLALYDVARLCFGENALSEVCGNKKELTLLDYLLLKEREGLFEL